MKSKIFLIFTFIFTNSALLLSQSIDSSDYFDYASNKIFDYLSQLANNEDKPLSEYSLYKHYIIWKNNFETKLDEYSKMNSFGESIYNYYDNPTDIQGEIELIWEYNCPDSLVPNWDDELQINSGQQLIISLWINPNNFQHILAGGQFQGGLWETLNGGQSWQNITEDYPQIQGISSIFVNFNDTSNIWITTSYEAEGPRGYSNGLYYTNDGGTTWDFNECYTYDPFEPSPGAYYPFANAKFSPRAFLQNPLNDSIMYLLTPYKLLFSNDKGENWTVLINKWGENYNPADYYDVWAAKQYFEDMAFDLANPDVVYVTGPEAFRVYNSGQNIENITQLILNNGDSLAQVICVETHENYPDSVWFSYMPRDTTKKYFVAIYNKQTGNYIRTEVPLTNQVYLSPYYLHCEVSPLNPDYIIVGGAKPYCLEFSTGNIAMLGYDPGFHNDIRTVEWVADERGIINFALFGTDGGITRKDAPSPTNVNLSDYEYIANNGVNPGIRNLDIQGFDVSNYGDELIVVGHSHNGINFKHDNSWRTKQLYGGDYQSILIDPDSSDNIYATRYATRELIHFSDHGKTYEEFFIGYDDHGDKFPLLFFAPNNSSTIYAGTFKEIWEFDAANLILPPTNKKYNFSSDEYEYQYIKEVGTSIDLDNMFFVATDRYWMSWKG